MPWRESCVMDERMRFVVDHLGGEWTMSELCDRYGISRQTGYKWIGRYGEEGAAGLVDRSRAAKVHGRATPAAICDLIVRCERRGRAGGRARSSPSSSLSILM